MAGRRLEKAILPQVWDLREDGTKKSGGRLIMSLAGNRAGRIEDDELMRLIAKGDQRAAKKLVAQQLPKLLSLARHLLGKEEEAEEVAQEAFFEALETGPGLATPSRDDLDLAFACRLQSLH